MSWLYLLFILPLVAMIVFFGWRAIRGISRKVESGQTTWEDDWDPFQ